MVVEAQRRLEDSMTGGVGQWRQQQPLSGLMPRGESLIHLQHRRRRNYSLGLVKLVGLVQKDIPSLVDKLELCREGKQCLSK